VHFAFAVHHPFSTAYFTNLSSKPSKFADFPCRMSTDPCLH
jgi:hypothetical protein